MTEDSVARNLCCVHRGVFNERGHELTSPTNLEYLFHRSTDEMHVYHLWRKSLRSLWNCDGRQKQEAVSHFERTVATVMDNHQEDNCIFCKIVRKQAPSVPMYLILSFNKEIYCIRSSNERLFIQIWGWARRSLYGYVFTMSLDKIYMHSLPWTQSIYITLSPDIAPVTKGASNEKFSNRYKAQNPNDIYCN
jgi:hypothetical protein